MVEMSDVKENRVKEQGETNREEEGPTMSRIAPLQNAYAKSSECDCVWRQGFKGQMRPCGWALIQSYWCPYKRLGHRHTHTDG